MISFIRVKGIHTGNSLFFDSALAKLQFFSHRAGNKVLQNETIMFEKYLKRVEPNLAAAATTTTAAPAPSQSTHDARVMRKRSKSKGSGVDKHLKLNAEQKCDIAQREIEELREEIDKLKEDAEKILDTYKVVMDLHGTETPAFWFGLII